MYALNLQTIGASTATTIPKELRGKLGVAAGDTVYVTETPDGSFHLTPQNPAFAAQMDIAEQIIRDDRDVLHALAN